MPLSGPGKITFHKDIYTVVREGADAIQKVNTVQIHTDEMDATLVHLGSLLLVLKYLDHHGLLVMAVAVTA